MIQIHTCEQGSEEWFRIRAGMPTASEFSTVMASGRGGGESKARRTYMLKLAGEILTGEACESFVSADMMRGHEMEPEARNLYSFLTDTDPVQVGFIRNGNAGCSPDALIGDNGMLEIKTKKPALQLDVLLRGEVPPEHKAQTQGQLWVAEREFVDFVSYWPKLPLFVHRTYRDEAYIKTISDAVDRFNDELAALVEQIRAMEPRQLEAA